MESRSPPEAPPTKGSIEVDDGRMNEGAYMERTSPEGAAAVFYAFTVVAGLATLLSGLGWLILRLRRAPTLDA